MPRSHHLNITSDIIKPRYGMRRYFLLPGSVKRAEIIASMFDEVEGSIITGRKNDTHIGYVVSGDGRKIDIGVTATGMGVGSTEIIVTELIEAGAQRFLRVGTSGAIIDEPLQAGDFVIATGAVRDELASRHYLPLEFPALADYDVVQACKKACTKLDVARHSYAGVIHSKASLYARAKMYGPLRHEHEQYKQILKEALVLSSEMEASMLFILSQCHTKKVYTINSPDSNDGDTIKSGALLGIIGTEKGWSQEEKVLQIEKNTCSLAIEAIRQLFVMEN